jgi:hypothetical protein
MENRAPMLSEVFEGGSPLWTLADLPKFRIYASALLTPANYADRLRQIVELTGGVGSLDVKHIGDPVDYAVLVQKWFVSSFKRLYGMVAPNEIPDPEITPEDGAQEHVVPVTLGNDKLVCYALYGATEASKWTFGVIPPGQADAIYFSGAAAYPGVQAFSGSMFQALSFDLPLQIPGQEHRWAGDWKIVVARNAGTGTGRYAVGALVRQDMETRLELIAPALPQPGDAVRLRAVVRDQDGRAVTDAEVATTVQEPGPWPGHAVAVEVGSNLELVKRLRQSTKKVDADTPAIADGVLRDLYARAALGSGRRTRVPLAHSGGGVYEAEIRLRNPGDYDFDTTITGVRRSSQEERDAKLGGAIAGLASFYTAKELRAQKAWLKGAAGAKQGFTVELRDQLAVAFKPTVKDSETGGFFADADTIRLLVQPKGAGGVLLGPGYAGSILFFAPGGIELPWPATDLGDGNYQVDIEVHRRGAVRFERRHLALAADRFALVHPAAGPLDLRGGLLPLAEFAVEVLGVRMPLAVMSIVGNSKSRECHLVTCGFAAKIAEKNRVWMHDLEQARACGYDTCEHCLPLVCNMNPSSMEAHKPFCSWTKKIRPRNRLEVHSLTQALELGFDGCRYCLPTHHTR